MSNRQSQFTLSVPCAGGAGQLSRERSHAIEADPMPMVEREGVQDLLCEDATLLRNYAAWQFLKSRARDEQIEAYASRAKGLLLESFSRCPLAVIKCPLRATATTIAERVREGEA